MSEIEFKASPLTISTCTVITNLNTKISLDYLTRFLEVYDQHAPELELKRGGVYNIEYYGNCARGETYMDKIKDEFNNQTTIKFKYWGFRNINIKIFANGRLQMTGPKYENEGAEIAKLLVDIIKDIKVKIQCDIKNILPSSQIIPDASLGPDVTKLADFQLVYCPEMKTVSYYRRDYSRFLKNYSSLFDRLDTLIKDLVEKEQKDIKESIIDKPNSSNGICKNQNGEIILNGYHFNINNKVFEMGIHNCYDDYIEKDKDISDKLIESNWFSDKRIMEIIDKIEIIKSLFRMDLQKVLTDSKSLDELRTGIINIGQVYNDFEFREVNNILKNINDGSIYANDDRTLLDIKNIIHGFEAAYFKILNKKIYRMTMIRNMDVSICHMLGQFLEQKLTSGNPPVIITTNATTPENAHQCKIFEIPLTDIELFTGRIEGLPEYNISGTHTVMINSDFSVNFNINLKKMTKILKKRGLFNTYEPDEHSGVNVRYYYNPLNVMQGFCGCDPHCSTREKRAICTKITVLIFRPGSIIITGSRSLEQLKAVHSLIIDVLKENMTAIMIEDKPEDHKQVALLNNEFRKVSRKSRLFYIKKEKIITPESAVL